MKQYLKKLLKYFCKNNTFRPLTLFMCCDWKCNYIFYLSIYVIYLSIYLFNLEYSFKRKIDWLHNLELQFSLIHVYFPNIVIYPLTS